MHSWFAEAIGGDAASVDVTTQNFTDSVIYSKTSTEEIGTGYKDGITWQLKFKKRNHIDQFGAAFGADLFLNCLINFYTGESVVTVLWM